MSVVPELAGLAEVAGMLGLSKSAASKRTRRPDFPPPLAQLDCGAVWAADDVREYARQRADRFVERAGVESLAAVPTPAAGESPLPFAGVVPVEEAAATLSVSAASLRALHRAMPWLPGRMRARDGLLLGIPVDGLGLWARCLSARPREIAAWA